MEVLKWGFFVKTKIDRKIHLKEENTSQKTESSTPRYNFGSDHPLLLDVWRTRLDQIWSRGETQTPPSVTPGGSGAGSGSGGDSQPRLSVQEKQQQQDTIFTAEKAVELAKLAFGVFHMTTAYYYSMLGHVGCIYVQNTMTC